MGRQKKQTEYELRQTEQSIEVSLCESIYTNNDLLNFFGWRIQNYLNIPVHENRLNLFCGPVTLLA